VVGLALLPQDPHSSFDQGVWMTEEGLVGRADPSKLLGDERLAVTFHHGVATDATVARLGDQLGVETGTTSLPQDVTFLHNVRTVPKALAAFLALLGLAAVGHGLVSGVRRRRPDLAVLRAIGFRPRQAAACVAWHGTTVAVIALVIGIPLGIATGHWTWRLIANATPLLYVAPVATLVVVLIGPATLVLANLLAALPARRAARLRTTEILRVE
jgi:hypothetical protein